MQNRYRRSDQPAGVVAPCVLVGLGGSRSCVQRQCLRRGSTRECMHQVQALEVTDAVPVAMLTCVQAPVCVGPELRCWRYCEACFVNLPPVYLAVGG